MTWKHDFSACVSGLMYSLLQAFLWDLWAHFGLHSIIGLQYHQNSIDQPKESFEWYLILFERDWMQQMENLYWLKIFCHDTLADVAHPAHIEIARGTSVDIVEDCFIWTQIYHYDHLLAFFYHYSNDKELVP